MIHFHSCLQNLEWRKTNQVDDIVEKWTPPEVLVKYNPIGICGRDKFHCPGKPTIKRNQYKLKQY